MTQLTYYPPREREPETKRAWTPEPDDVHTLRHGYNLADVNQLARRAVWRVWGLHLDYVTRFDLAWSGIVEHLYAAAEPPTPADLVHAGYDALANHVQQSMHLYGVDRHDRRGETMRGFVAYWEPRGFRGGSPEGLVVERAALWQIWPRLSDRHRGVLLALAAHGTYQAAAASLDLSDKMFKHHLSHARRAFLELWHEGETPSRIWGCDRRVVRAGDEQASAATYRKAVKAIRRGRTARPAPPEIKHGTLRAYNTRKCRCPQCVEAKRQESTARRAKAGSAVRRRMSVEEWADVQRRRDAGETWTSIAASLGYSTGYLRALNRGAALPVVTA